MEGIPGDNTLTGAYPRRMFAVPECFEIAKKYGRNVFAIQDGGQCFTFRLENENGTKPYEKQHEKLGNSSACLGEGKGGPLANDVYIITRGSTTK